VGNPPPNEASFLSAPPGQEESLDRMAGAANYNAWLLDRAEPFIGRRVLDFGAGIGTFTAAIAARAEVVAVEPDPRLGPGLRKRFAGNGHVTVVEDDAGWLAGDDAHGTFDTVLCLNVLEHIRDDALVLRGFHDALSLGGHLLLLVPAHRTLFGEIDRSVGHERRYSRGPLRHLLERTDLQPIELRYVNPLGAVGWFVASQLLRRDQVPEGPLHAYDQLVPMLRRLDRLRLPFGLSIWAVAQRTD
jgi:SAM-dependent methyltransferase